MAFETRLITNRKPVDNVVIALMLDEYNKGLDEPIYLETREKTGCFPAVRIAYQIYKAVADMPNHYVYLHTVEEPTMLKLLAQALNEKEK